MQERARPIELGDLTERPGTLFCCGAVGGAVRCGTGGPGAGVGWREVTAEQLASASLMTTVRSPVEYIEARAAWIDPDPASASGRSVRVIGHSSTADDVLTVILLPADTDPDDRPTGEWWGANAWPSNARDRRIYEQEHEGRNGA
jgi:hypothetical protein